MAARSHPIFSSQNLGPDIFIVDESSRVAVVFELTCPWDNSNIVTHASKEDKYSSLVAHFSNTYGTFHFFVEVSVRGQVTGANKARLKKLLSIGSVLIQRWFLSHW